jgi:hypothetical protein
MLGQIQNTREIESNGEDDARVPVDRDESGSSQPFLSTRDLAGGNGVRLGQVDRSRTGRSEAATAGRSSCPVENGFGIHEGIADAPKVNTPARLGLAGGPSRDEAEFDLA